MLVENVRRAITVAKKNDWDVVISSHLPIFKSNYIDSRLDFDHLQAQHIDDRLAKFLINYSPFMTSGTMVTNLVTGTLTYSPESILTQIIHGIEHSSSSSEYVILWEHDVMYPEGYAERMVEELDKGHDYAVYRDHLFMDRDGFFKPGVHFWHLSRYAAKKDVLQSHFTQKIELEQYEILEPVPKGHTTGEEAMEDIVDDCPVVDGEHPVLDIRHGANASGQIIVDAHMDTDTYWGDAENFKKFFEDREYDSFLTSKPEVGYGLFTISSADIW